MRLDFQNKKISGILTVIPENIVNFDDEIENYNFTEKQCKKLKLIMGYDKKRIAKEGVCSSDLCEFGMNYLFDNSLLKREEIDALILVTQSPDYFMPATSNILHGKPHQLYFFVFKWLFLGAWYNNRSNIKTNK